MAQNNDLLLSLINIGVFKVGEFTLKSGVSSPIYIDLRSIIAYPDIVRQIVQAVRSKQLELNLETDVICGVPYTALPIASVFSVLNDIPMIMRRKEVKNYGTKKIVEGIITKGNRCLIIEDIVSSGSSILETAEILEKEGLVVTDCITVLNRLQGGIENLAKAGITLHSLFTINEFFEKYCSVNKVEASLVEKVKSYLKDNYIPIKKSVCNNVLHYNQRAALCEQPILKKLFNIVHEKESNLCVAVDVVSSKDLLKVATDLGPHICILKTHIDILNDFSRDVADSLKSIASAFNFLILEDRKFADIGNTVMYQYSDGLYSIKNWADIVTVHGIPGDGIVKALKSSVCEEKRACVLIAEMSSEGALTNADYQNKVIEMSMKHPDFVIGFITQHKLVDKTDSIHMCPGVSISSKGDSLGQQYKSPEEAINNGADIVIVGRGICKAPNMIEAAIQYKTTSYNAYIKKCQI